MINKIVKYSVFGLCAGFMLLLTAYEVPADGIKGDYQQGLRGYQYLLKIRKDPNSYTERLRVSLKDIPAGPAIRYNDTLAMVAEQKAEDMAANDYFSKVDKKGYGINYYINKAGFRLDTAYLKHKNADDFEVMIAGGWQSGEDAIGALVTDKESSSGENRKFLLAQTDFSRSLTEIGIGFVHGTKDTKYRYYTVVIMAKRRGSK